MPTSLRPSGCVLCVGKDFFAAARPPSADPSRHSQLARRAVGTARGSVAVQCLAPQHHARHANNDKYKYNTCNLCVHEPVARQNGRFHEPLGRDNRRFERVSSASLEKVEMAMSAVHLGVCPEDLHALPGLHPLHRSKMLCALPPSVCPPSALPLACAPFAVAFAAGLCATFH